MHVCVVYYEGVSVKCKWLNKWYSNLLFCCMCVCERACVCMCLAFGQLHGHVAETVSSAIWSCDTTPDTIVVWYSL